MSERICRRSGETDVVHRYVAGTLALDELRVFEVHLLACPTCQAAVREGSALRDALSGDTSRERGGARVAALRTRGRRPIVQWILPVAAAAILAVVLLSRPDPVRGLGAVAATPRFAPLAVRSPGSQSMRRLDSAMEVYGRGDFARAGTLLAAIAAEDSDAAVSFYAGHATLAAGDPRGAIPHLWHVLHDTAGARRGVPYRDDARYFLAKAWLQLREPDSALAVLEQSSDAAGRALRDSVAARTR